jgi:cysteine desulfurase
MEPSHVVRALGIETELGRSAIRFSLGASTTFDEIAYALDCVEKVVARTFRHR